MPSDRETLLGRIRPVTIWAVGESAPLAVCGRCGSVLMDDVEHANRREHEEWHEAIEAPVSGSEGEQDTAEPPISDVAQQVRKAITAWHTNPVDATILTNAVMAVVTPELKAAFLRGHDAGVDDPWAEQQPVVDSELRDRIQRAYEEQPSEFIHLDEFGGWEVDYPAFAEIAWSVVAPVLAAKDAETERTGQTAKDLAALVDKLKVEVRQYAEERDTAIVDLKELSRHRDFLTTYLNEVGAELKRERQIKAEVLDTNWLAIQSLRGEIDRAGQVLKAADDRGVWESPPSLWDRVELVVSELYIARKNVEKLQQRMAERDEVNAGWVAYRGRTVEEIRTLRAELDAYRDLLGCIWLYVKWRYVTKQLETVQKDLWADAVDRWQPDPNEPPPVARAERWWRDDAPVGLPDTEPSEQAARPHPSEAPVVASLPESPWQPGETDTYAGGPAICTSVYGGYRCELGVGHDGDHRRYVGPYKWELWKDQASPATPTEPRVWRDADDPNNAQPADVYRVRDTDGHVWEMKLGGDWACRSGRTPNVYAWFALMAQCGPLTEVVAADSGSASTAEEERR